MVTVLNEARHAGSFVLSEAAGHRSRDAIVVKAGAGVLVAGTVLGKTVTGSAAAVSAKSGNTGNGVLTLDAVTPVLGNAKQGRYAAVAITAGAAAVFEVSGPDGVEIGTYATAAAAFANGIKFTIAAGATAFAAGDTFFIDVAINQVKYEPTNLAATDGSSVAAAVLLAGVDASSVDAAATAIVRDAEVNGFILTYDPSVTSAAQIAQKQTELKALGIIVR
jgi:Bacteriophage lambda head decoration protein D